MIGKAILKTKCGCTRETTVSWPAPWEHRALLLPHVQVHVGAILEQKLMDVVDMSTVKYRRFILSNWKISETGERIANYEEYEDIK